MQITSIQTELIKPNEYNPNIVQDEIMIKLRAEISQKGFCVPITVRQEDDSYEIVDGYHRWLIAKELGLNEIPCIIQDYDDTEAKIKTLQLNYLKGSAVPIKLASLIHDLSKEIKLEDLAKRLPYDESQMLDNLELLKLPEDFGKAIEEQAFREEEELPSVISFVLYEMQLELVEEAIKIAIQSLPKETKNLRALALEKICADFITRQGVNKAPESTIEG